MRKMGIDPDMTLGEALEYFPQVLPMFLQLGLCCVNADNEGWTVSQLCGQAGVDPEEFAAAVNSIL